MNIELQILDDETDLLQYGQSEKTPYFQTQMDIAKPSSEISDLIADPNGQYKFSSIEILAQKTKVTTSRQTYSILDWLGDVGGLNDALYLIAQMLIFPYTKFYHAAFVMRSIFRW